MVNANDAENKFSKALWGCRRGMLELDVMLQNFCNKAYTSLSAEKQQLFDELLEANDQDLLSWLVGSQPAANPKLQDMILVIRHMHAVA